jgi:hypothetical protein
MPNITVDGHVFECIPVKKGAAIVVKVPFTIHMSAGLHERAQQEVRTRFVGVKDVFFENATPLSSTQELIEFEGDEEPWVSVQTDSDTERRARLIVNGWLAEKEINGNFSNIAPVKFIHGSQEWRKIGRQHDMPTTPVDRIDMTEGYTTHQKENATVQSAEVFINGDNHTVGAVVHELFHTLSHPMLGNVWDGVGPHLEESLTEYLTCMATRLFYRRDIRGNTIYSKGLMILRKGIDDNAFTEQDLINVFFKCDETNLKKVSKYYHDELNKKT